MYVFRRGGGSTVLAVRIIFRILTWRHFAAAYLQASLFSHCCVESCCRETRLALFRLACFERFLLLLVDPRDGCATRRRTIGTDLSVPKEISPSLSCADQETTAAVASQFREDELKATAVAVVTEEEMYWSSAVIRLCRSRFPFVGSFVMSIHVAFGALVPNYARPRFALTCLVDKDPLRNLRTNIALPLT